MKQRQKSGSILVVDDETDFLELIQVIFSEAYNVRGVTTVEDALRELRQVNTDIVLLDVHLPRRSGWDVLRTLAQQPAAPPVIVVTADGRAQIRAQAEQLGAVYTLVKPVVPRQLRKIVERCMEAYRSLHGVPASRRALAAALLNAELQASIGLL